MSEEIVTSDWENQFAATLPLFGHRNWIVIADAAYPAQSRVGIETVVTDTEQLDVLQTVIDRIAASNHVRAKVYLDHELEFVSGQNAPGVADYRRELQTILADSLTVKLPHEQIIHKLDQAAQVFRILILKTTMTIPYTSVFLELDCGYWSADAEQELRSTITNSQAE